MRRSLARPGVVRRVIALAKERKVWSIRIAKPDNTNLLVNLEQWKEGRTWIRWVGGLSREDLRRKRDLYKVL